MQQGSDSLKCLKVKPLKRAKPTHFNAFALYEVLLGVAIFAIGVIALGRAVEKCLNASTISGEESAVRQILSRRMAVVQAAPGGPEPEKELKVNDSYGPGRLIQQTAPAELS